MVAQDEEVTGPHYPGHEEQVYVRVTYASVCLSVSVFLFCEHAYVCVCLAVCLSLSLFLSLPVTNSFSLLLFSVYKTMRKHHYFKMNISTES